MAQTGSRTPGGPSSKKPPSSGPSRSWFTIPAPLARLFKRFPLLLYEANELPIRSRGNQSLPLLFVFSTDVEALRGLPSFNPTCLKWQTFLKLAGVDFRVVAANNHASSMGSLPFLISPPSPLSNLKSTEPDSAPSILYSSSFESYALTYGSESLPAPPRPRVSVYLSLLDYQIRAAWLYSLYLSPANTALLTQTYIDPTSSAWAVRKTTLHQLRRAAEAEILRCLGLGSSAAVKPVDLYVRAEGAFKALDQLLGQDEWFFGHEQPGLFDASVFAYTHLLLDSGLAWGDGDGARLKEILKGNANLAGHEDRLVRRLWVTKYG